LPLLAVKLSPEADIGEVAAEHGATVRYAIGNLAGWWLLDFPDAQLAQSALPLLADDPRVEEAQLQHRQQMTYRTNDPLFGSQWHLKKSGAATIDLNAEAAWNAGFTGAGVKLMVCDDSLEHTHPDLAPNYNAADSYDYADNDADPAPMSSQEQHGTCTSGTAAARGNNGLGVSGVAYEATLSGIRMDANFPDAAVAAAESHSNTTIDIYSNSWGPGPYEPMGTLTRQAILDGIANGRGGKGCIFVWACGNGRYWGDNGNNDPFQTMPETISVSSIAIDGLVADYSEKGACILVCSPAGESSGGTPGGGSGGNVVTTDRTGSDGYGGLSDDDYTNAFGGTSASCPEVAGVCALILQANPNLTWRDVQHILVQSANSTTGVQNSGWSTNGAGRRVHGTLGFGCVDAGAAVTLAQSWTNVAAQQQVQSSLDSANATIPDGTGATLTRTINFANSMDLEHVVVEFQSTHPYWDQLDVTLTSPSGTASRLIEANTSGFPPMPGANYAPAGGSWKFMTTHCWDEDAAGTWTLTIKDAMAGASGMLNSWRLNFHGTNNTPIPPTPTINVSTTSLSLIAPDANTISNSKSYTVSGANLAADVDITAPTGFEIATAATGPWLAGLTLAQTGGTLASTTVHVRFDPNATGGAANGTLAHTSAGAAQKNVGVSGGVGGTGGTINTTGRGAASGGGCVSAPGGSAALLCLLPLLWLYRRRKLA
jgi:subtilisin-like proprotein convertase family protein